MTAGNDACRRANGKAQFRSWGNIPHCGAIARPAFRDELLRMFKARGETFLAVGHGRSYGDSCLNAGGTLVVCTRMNRLLAFDRGQASIRVEAGAAISEILKVTIPAGFVLPVVPGTSQITVGGAIANDIHGKDSAARGNFGNWVNRIEMLRSDGEILNLSPGDPLFHATIGGLGLTGMILSADLKLIPLPTSEFTATRHWFRDMNDMWALWDEPAFGDGATTAWLDLALRPGSGVMTTGKPFASGPSHFLSYKGFDVPTLLEFSAINRFSVAMLNATQHLGNRRREEMFRTSYSRFHFPLDRLGHWNRLYGRRGFYQYQCALPRAIAREAIDQLLSAVRKSGILCTLAVIKRFGDIASPGLLSFALPGFSLAMDFPNKSPATLQLLDRLDSIVMEGNGKLYPAKDARMGPAVFEKSYPELRRFLPHVDARFRSDFWSRVMGHGV